jgi:hypothetical protein
MGVLGGLISDASGDLFRAVFFVFVVSFAWDAAKTEVGKTPQINPAD